MYSKSCSLQRTRSRMAVRRLQPREGKRRALTAPRKVSRSPRRARGGMVAPVDWQRTVCPCLGWQFTVLISQVDSAEQSLTTHTCTVLRNAYPIGECVTPIDSIVTAATAVQNSDQLFSVVWPLTTLIFRALTIDRVVFQPLTMCTFTEVYGRMHTNLTPSLVYEWGQDMQLQLWLLSLWGWHPLG